MKKLLLFLSFILYTLTSPCQQVPNGNMELWDSTGIEPYPFNWLTNAFAPSLPCWPPPFSVFQTNDASSGDYATKLEAVSCIDPGFIQRVYIGYLALGNTSTPTDGINYSDRPDNLNFYYKFNKVGTDTGFARIRLSLDSLGYPGALVGEGKFSIINNTNTYTLGIVPINYLLPDTPQILQIIFATSKTLVDNSYLSYPLSTTPGNGAYIGTTLWIDDVTVSGGTVAVPELLDEKLWQIYPNPTNDFSMIEFKNPSSDSNLKIFNSLGKLVKSVKNISRDNVKIEKDNLTPGIYYFLINNKREEFAKGKWIIY
jgi:hypothetical protein